MTKSTGQLAAEIARALKPKRSRRSRGPRIVDVIAETPTGYRWIRQFVASSAKLSGASLLPDGKFAVVDEGAWQQTLRAAAAKEI